MRVYLLSMKASINWQLVPEVDAYHTVKGVAGALRDAADELEDYADWKVWQGLAGNDPVVLEVKADACPEITELRIEDAAREHFGIRYLSIDSVDWTEREYRDADFPDWALGTLVNGDPLEDAEDRRAYDAWERRMLADGYDLLSPDVLDDHNEFCAHPEFGLGSETTKVRFFKKEVKHAT